MSADGHENCRYWGLTLAQCSRHHARLAGYYARRSREYADKAGRLSRVALILAGGSLGMIACVVLLYLVAWMLT